MSSQAEQPAISAAQLDALIRAAVEAVASSHPDPENPFRGLYISDELALALASGAPSDYVDERLADVSRALALEPLDTAVLGLCAAPELNPRYGRLFAYLQDDVTRKLASPRLVAQLLRGLECATTEVLERFAHDAPLRRCGAIRLLESDGAMPLAEQPVKVPARLAAALIGARIDTPGESGLRHARGEQIDPGRHDHVARLAALLAHDERLPIVVAGPDAAAIVERALGRPVLLARLVDIVDPELLADAALIGALDGAALAFDASDDLEPPELEQVRRALDARGERTLIVAASAGVATALGDRTVLVIELPMPDVHERERAWTALSGAGSAADVAAKFRLSIAQVAEGARAARLAASGRGGEVAPTPADLDLGARQASSSRLGELATRLATDWRWRDLIVPAKQLEALQSISAYLRHRDHVLTDWEYEGVVSRHQGLKALFAGDSGTGKTMAAQVLAAELGLDIYRVDLATIVSKYIGDTEKNLDRIFAAAEGSNAILFFDEADALFGKRSDVGDAHDRYANIEVAYLLQKMDGYAGAVILATNLRRNIDAAFIRRLDFVIDFPFPEEEDRRRLWRGCSPSRRRETPTSTSTSSPSGSSSQAGRSATARCRPRSRPPTRAARSGCATSSAASRASTASSGD